MSNQISGISSSSSEYSSQSTQLSSQDQKILEQLESDPSQAATLLQGLPKEERHAIMKQLEKENPQAAEQAHKSLHAAFEQGDGKPPQTGESFNLSA